MKCIQVKEELEKLEDANRITPLKYIQYTADYYNDLSSFRSTSKALVSSQNRILPSTYNTRNLRNYERLNKLSDEALIIAQTLGLDIEKVSMKCEKLAIDVQNPKMIVIHDEITKTMKTDKQVICVEVQTDTMFCENCSKGSKEKRTMGTQIGKIPSKEVGCQTDNAFLPQEEEDFIYPTNLRTRSVSRSSGELDLRLVLNSARNGRVRENIARNRNVSIDRDTRVIEDWNLIEPEVHPRRCTSSGSEEGEYKNGNRSNTSSFRENSPLYRNYSDRHKRKHRHKSPERYRKRSEEFSSIHSYDSDSSRRPKHYKRSATPEVRDYRDDKYRKCQKDNETYPPPKRYNAYQTNHKKFMYPNTYHKINKTSKPRPPNVPYPEPPNIPHFSFNASYATPVVEESEEEDWDNPKPKPKPVAAAVLPPKPFPDYENWDDATSSQPSTSRGYKNHYSKHNHYEFSPINEDRDENNKSPILQIFPPDFKEKFHKRGTRRPRRMPRD